VNSDWQHHEVQDNSPTHKLMVSRDAGAELTVTQ